MKIVLKLSYYVIILIILFISIIEIREEVKKVEDGVWDKANNPLKNAPHTQEMCISSNWNKPYSREVAAYPIVSYSCLQIQNNNSLCVHILLNFIGVHRTRVENMANLR